MSTVTCSLCNRDSASCPMRISAQIGTTLQPVRACSDCADRVHTNAVHIFNTIRGANVTQEGYNNLLTEAVQTLAPASPAHARALVGMRLRELVLNLRRG